MSYINVVMYIAPKVLFMSSFFYADTDGERHDAEPAGANLIFSGCLTGTGS